MVWNRSTCLFVLIYSLSISCLQNVMLKFLKYLKRMQSKINESARETSQGLLNRLIDCPPIDTEESNAITRQIVEIL